MKEFNSEEVPIKENEFLTLGDVQLGSRLIMGSGKFKTLELMQKCHEVCKTEMVTISLRRISLDPKQRRNNIINFINKKKTHILANTAGVGTGEEALRLAHIAIELGLKFLKIEVIGEIKSLLPDPLETLRAVKIIKEKHVSEKIFLMVYTNDDPILAHKLYQAGADCIMPGGSPIGSGRGIQNPYNMRMILDMLKGKLPLIIDAGIGSPADVVLAMEMGFDAVLLNSAVSRAQNPIKMSEAMYYASLAGRASFLSGRIPQKLYSSASSPVNSL